MAMLPRQQVRPRRRLGRRRQPNPNCTSARWPFDSSAITGSAPANIRIFSAPGSPVIGNCSGCFFAFCGGSFTTLSRSQNNRGACEQRPRQRCLAEVKCDFDVTLPVDGELLPALLVQRRAGGNVPPPRTRISGWSASKTLEGARCSIASSATCAPLRIPASTIADHDHVLVSQ